MNIRPTKQSAEEAVLAIEYLISRLERSPRAALETVAHAREVVRRLQLDLTSGRREPAAVEHSALAVQAFLAVSI